MSSYPSIYHYRATLAGKDAVVDGDSVRLIVDCGFHQRREDLYRLYGIDAPERRGESKEAGLDAKAHLQQLLDGRELVVLTHKPEKYGRWLVTIFREVNGAWQNVNAAMVAAGHATEYHGGKR